MSTQKKADIEKRFSELGKDPIENVKSVLTLDMEIGESRDFIFKGISEEAVTLDPQYGETFPLVFIGRDGYERYEAGAVLVGMYQNGELTPDSMYRLVFIEMKKSGKGNEYKKYMVSELVSNPDEEQGQESTDDETASV